MANNAATITMTMREADRLKTVQAVVDRMLRVGQAAQRLGIGRRQVERIVQRYVAEGAAGLVSRKRGNPANERMRWFLHRWGTDLHLRVFGVVRRCALKEAPVLRWRRGSGSIKLTDLAMG